MILSKRRAHHRKKPGPKKDSKPSRGPQVYGQLREPFASLQRMAAGEKLSDVELLEFFHSLNERGDELRALHREIYDMREGQQRQQREREREPRRSEWERITREVEQIADRLGHPVDDGIKQTVVALRAHQLETSASCEGHADQGAPFPWIEVSTAEPQGWRESPEAKKAWLEANLRQREQVLGLLEIFYRQRRTQFDSRLIPEPHGLFGAFRLVSLGAAQTPILSAAQIETQMRAFRKEMEDFTAFLTTRYLDDRSEESPPGR